MGKKTAVTVTCDLCFPRPRRRQLAPPWHPATPSCPALFCASGEVLWKLGGHRLQVRSEVGCSGEGRA